jgi:hypothetical protein
MASCQPTYLSARMPANTSSDAPHYSVPTPKSMYLYIYIYLEINIAGKDASEHLLRRATFLSAYPQRRIRIKHMLLSRGTQHNERQHIYITHRQGILYIPYITHLLRRSHPLRMTRARGAPAVSAEPPANRQGSARRRRGQQRRCSARAPERQ